jgi:hypothetical protein
VGTRTHEHTRKRTSRSGSKAALDDDIQQNEEYPSKDLEKWLKKETKKIRKERWRNGSNNILRRHKRHDEKGSGGNLQTENGIYESYPWTLNERNALFATPDLHSYGTGQKLNRSKER